jgi:flagellar basal body-associated protein FliL
MLSATCGRRDWTRAVERRLKEAGKSMKTTLIVLTVVNIVVLVGALAFYLAWVSKLLNNIADGLAEVNEMVHGEVIGHANTIVPDLQHTNRTLSTISGALPLLYGLAEKITVKKAAGPAGAAGRAGVAG